MQTDKKDTTNPSNGQLFLALVLSNDKSDRMAKSDPTHYFRLCIISLSEYTRFP